MRIPLHAILRRKLAQQKLKREITKAWREQNNRPFATSPFMPRHLLDGSGSLGRTCCCHDFFCECCGCAVSDPFCFNTNEFIGGGS